MERVVEYYENRCKLGLNMQKRENMHTSFVLQRQKLMTNYLITFLIKYIYMHVQIQSRFQNNTLKVKDFIEY